MVKYRTPAPQNIRLTFAGLAAGVFAVVSGAQAHEPAGEATYLANAGVLVSVCGEKILFDAFYEDSYGRYALVPDEARQDLLAGRPPYDEVSALFVSHVHGDHFSPAPALAYLRAWPDVKLYGSLQVADALAKAAGSDDEVLQRVIAFDLEPGAAPADAVHDALSIDVVAIPHSGGARMSDIDNLVFRVSLNQAATVMHLGDAVADEALFAGRQAHWDARRTDLVFPPFWFFRDDAGRRILENNIRAAAAVGVHVPAAAIGQGDGWRDESGGDLFTDPGETRVIGDIVCAAENR